jgi:predicted RNase H-like HicB family nuclease
MKGKNSGKKQARAHADRSGSHNGYARPNRTTRFSKQERQNQAISSQTTLQDDREILGRREGGAEMSESLRYPTQIFFSEDDGGYIAIAPGLPGCSAFGETAEEALRELQDAIKAWIGAAKKAGNPIPPPSPRQVEELPSGKVLARLPKTLHAQLIERAARDNRSLNTCLVMLLTKALGESPSARNEISRRTQIDVIYEAGRSSTALTVPTRFLTSWVQAHASHDAAIESARSLVGRVDKVSTGGSILNLFRLPVGKPVLYLDDENG